MFSLAEASFEAMKLWMHKKIGDYLCFPCMQRFEQIAITRVLTAKQRKNMDVPLALKNIVNHKGLKGYEKSPQRSA